MNNAEMKVVRFDERDVIATSGASASSHTIMSGYTQFSYLLKASTSDCDYLNGLTGITYANCNYVDSWTNMYSSDGSSTGDDYTIGKWYHACGTQDDWPTFVDNIQECNDSSHHFSQ